MNIITGLQANSGLHIGNYFGAVRPMVNSLSRLENGDKFFYFVPNLHSFTMPIDHSQLYPNTLYNIRILLASGVDPNDPRVYIFRQSRISQHAELAWALQCFTYFGEAGRMTQFKDKSLKDVNFSVGLFTYPILMAADILLYDCDYVPVGLDQQQHIELTRDLAMRLNNKFGSMFIPPKPWSEQLKFMNVDKGVKILSLTDPTKKMSKSDYDQKGCIYIEDTPKDVHKKIMGAATDSLGIIQYDPINQAGISNLLLILSCLRNQPIQTIVQEFSSMTQYGPFKQIVAQELSEFILQLQNSMQDITDEYIEDLLINHESRTRAIAQDKLQIVYNHLGL
jgi:tryptophanyl-tRNA synthetase